MTLEEAKREIPSFESFQKLTCDMCSNDWYCPSYCNYLEKAEKMDFDEIQKKFAQHDGDMKNVFGFIKRKRI